MTISTWDTGLYSTSDGTFDAPSEFSVVLIFVGGYGADTPSVWLDGTLLTNTYGIRYHSTAAIFFEARNVSQGTHSVHVGNFYSSYMRWFVVGLENAQTPLVDARNDGNEFPDHVRYSIMIPTDGIAICGGGFSSSDGNIDSINDYNKYNNNFAALAEQWTGVSGTFTGYSHGTSCISLVSYSPRPSSKSQNRVPAILGG